MQVDQISQLREYQVVIDSDDYLVAYSLGAGGTVVYRAFNLSSFGETVGKQIREQDLRHNRYFSSNKIVDGWLVEEFFIESLKLIPASEIIHHPNQFNYQILDNNHEQIRMIAREKKLPIGKVTLESFIDLETGSVRMLPMHTIRVTSRMNNHTMSNEIPKVLLQDFSPEVLENPNFFKKPESYLYTVAISYSQILTGIKNFEFYKSFQLEKLIPQHKDQLRVFKENILSKFSSSPKESIFNSQANLRNSDYHFLRNELLAKIYSEANSHENVDILSRLSTNYFFSNLRANLNESQHFLKTNITQKQGGILLLKGKTGTGKNQLISELVKSIKSPSVFVMSLIEESREYDSDLNPIYEILYKLVSRVTKEVLSSDEVIQESFREKFHSYLPYLVTLNEEAINLSPELKNDELEKGTGSLTDKELKSLARELINYLGHKGIYVVVRVDTDFKIGMSRARSNTNDVSELTKNLPLTIVSSYNEEGSEYNLGFRLADVHSDNLKYISCDLLNTKDIKRFLEILCLEDKEKAELVANQLSLLSKAKVGTLRELLVYSLNHDYVVVRNTGEVHWDIEALSSSFVQNDSEKVALEFLKRLSVEEGTMLKRLALVKASLPSSLIAEGIEHYGQTGIQNLEALGLLSRRTVEGATEATYSLATSMVRSEILSDLDRRERIFLSIQLARSLSQSEHREALIEQEADLWAKTIDYVNGDSDRKRALDAVMKLGKRYFRISDFRYAEKFLSLAEKILTDMESYETATKIDLCATLGAVTFRLGKVDQALDYYDWALQNVDSLEERVRYRNELVDLYSLVGASTEAIKYTKQNFKDLDFVLKKEVGLFDVLKNFILIFTGTVNPKSFLNAPRIDNPEIIRRELILETIIRGASPYYIVEPIQFLFLTMGIKKLCKGIGKSKFLPLAYLSDAIIAVTTFGSRKKSKKFFDIATRLADEMGNSFVKSRISSVKAIFIDTLTYDDDKLIQHFSESAKRSFIARDEQFYTFTEMIRIMYMIFSGNYNYEKILLELQAFQYQCKMANRLSALRSIKIINWFLMFTLGRLSEEDRREQAGFESVIMTHKDNMAGYIYHLFLGLQKYFEREYEEADWHFRRCYKKEYASFSGPSYAYLLFFNLLNIIKIKETKSWWKAFQFSFIENKLFWELGRMSMLKPSKFFGKKVFLNSILRPKLSVGKGLEKMEEALSIVEQGKDHLSSLIMSDYLASALVSKNQQFRASKYLEQALEFSEKLNFQWYSDKLIQGFSVGDIKSEGSDINKAELSSNYQWSSIIQLVQEVGGEADSIKSLSKVLEYICKLTQSERGLFLLPKEDGRDWNLHSLFDKGFVELNLISDRATSLDDLCSMEVVNYSFELGKNLTLDNANEDSSFMDEAYIQEYKVKSIFCLPIIVNSKPVGVIYLENNSKTGNFEDTSIEVPSLLASLGYSIIEKAELYNSLEQKVVERTSTLNQVQKELTESAYQAGMAEVATETIHNLGNLLNSLALETEEVADKSAKLMSERVKSFKEILAKKKSGNLNFSEEEFFEYVESFSSFLENEVSEIENLSSKGLDRIGMIKNSIRSQQEFAKSSGFVEEIYINELVEQVYEVLKPVMLKREIGFQYDIAEGLFMVGVRSKIAQVLMNILKNAIDAFEGADKSKPKIILRAFISEDGKVCIEVQDNGIGIDAKNLKQIFEYGFTTKDSGHGFGLHSVAMMVEDMKGSIRVHSEGIGKGSIFILQFVPRNS